MNLMRWMVLGAVLLGPGCLNLPQFQAAKPVAAPAPVLQAPPPPSVLPEQVTENNGPEIAAALARELDQAATQPPSTPKVVDEKTAR